jgi:hypothetical protein
MLSTLLDQVPAALSRRFLLGTFLPLVLFWTGSLMLGYTCMAPVQDFVGWFEQRSPLMQAFLGTAAALALAAVGLALSGVSTLARQLLEAALLPRSWREWLEKRHDPRLDELLTERKTCSERRREIRGLREPALKILSDARKVGEARNPPLCVYPAPGSNLPGRIAGRPTDIEELKKLVDDLAQVLKTNSIAAGTDDSRRLNDAHVSLLGILEEQSKKADDGSRLAEIAIANEFPGDRTYATKFARVAGSLGAYALNRYGADYAVLWPRLEAVMRKERPELGEALQDATAQLEFHVTMFWMTCLFTSSWIVLLTAFGFNVWLFVGVTVLGLAACIAWYHLAAGSYAALADKAMTAVDLTRLKVFNALGVIEPRNTDEEREYWTDLSSTLAFGGTHKIPYLNRERVPEAPSEQRAYVRLERIKSADVPKKPDPPKA